MGIKWKVERNLESQSLLLMRLKSNWRKDKYGIKIKELNVAMIEIKKKWQKLKETRKQKLSEFKYKYLRLKFDNFALSQSPVFLKNNEG